MADSSLDNILKLITATKGSSQTQTTSSNMTNAQAQALLVQAELFRCKYLQM